MKARVKMDLKRIASFINHNNLWETRLCDLSAGEMERLAQAIVHIAGSWPPEIGRIINWLRDPMTMFPQEFQLNSVTKVTNGAAFKEGLIRDVESGPSGPRAFYGALQADLRRVYALFGPPEGQDEVPF